MWPTFPLELVEAMEKKTITPAKLMVEESRKKHEKLETRREKKEGKMPKLKSRVLRLHNLNLRQPPKKISPRSLNIWSFLTKAKHLK